MLISRIEVNALQDGAGSRGLGLWKRWMKNAAPSTPMEMTMTATIRKPARKRATPTKMKVAAENQNKAKPARPAGVKRSKTAANNPNGEAKPSIKPGTKTAILITLLSRPKGVTAEELMTAVGWQKHSVHGFLAGTVKKRLGLSLSSEQLDNGPRRYRIVNCGE